MGGRCTYGNGGDCEAFPLQRDALDEGSALVCSARCRNGTRKCVAAGGRYGIPQPAWSTRDDDKKHTHLHGGRAALHQHLVQHGHLLPLPTAALAPPLLVRQRPRPVRRPRHRPLLQAEEHHLLTPGHPG
eukprot:9014532-Pyramimonas_sp.AAC.1